MGKSQIYRFYAPQGDSDLLHTTPHGSVLRPIADRSAACGRAEARERSYVGSFGWEHPEWNGDFYPEDLPPEWRLAFYNTAFSCVYLAHEEWAGRDLQTLADWVADTREAFRFVLETDPSGLRDSDKIRLDVLAPRTGLILGSQAEAGGRVIWLEGSPDLKKLAKELQAFAATPEAVYLIVRDHDLETMHRVKTLLEIMGL